MAFNDRVRNNQQATSPSLNGVLVGASANGATLLVLNVTPGTLSATVTVDAETNTITLTPIWQASRDGSAWTDVHPENNAAYVAQATGTGGADPAVTRVLSAPAGVYGFRFARVVVRVGVVDGAVADSTTIAYNYLADNVV